MSIFAASPYYANIIFGSTPFLNFYKARFFSSGARLSSYYNDLIMFSLVTPLVTLDFHAFTAALCESATTFPYNYASFISARICLDSSFST